MKYWCCPKKTNKAIVLAMLTEAFFQLLNFALLGYRFECGLAERLALFTAGSVITIGLSINRCLHSNSLKRENDIDQSRSLCFANFGNFGVIVTGSRQNLLSYHSRRHKEALLAGFTLFHPLTLVLPVCEQGTAVPRSLIITLYPLNQAFYTVGIIIQKWILLLIRFAYKKLFTIF